MVRYTTRYYFLIILAMVLTTNHSLAQEDLVFGVDEVYFKMVFVKGGSFRMGKNSDTLYRRLPVKLRSDYDIEHSVEVSDFYIMETEVTQKLWVEVMGYNPSFHVGSNYPVENVSWKECIRFCRRLSKRTGHIFRLPTAAEWEYAARGGNRQDEYLYSGSDEIDSVAWYSENSFYETHRVKILKCNSLGLYDMSGNVGEWCFDWFGPTMDTLPQIDPIGPSLKQVKDSYKSRQKHYRLFFKMPKRGKKDSYKLKTVSGGYFESDWSTCVPSNHLCSHITNRSPVIGFRVVMQYLPTED